MTYEKTVNALNTLVEINNDRIKGYQTASKITKELELKTLFGQFAQRSHKGRKDLADEITRLGGIPSDGTKNTGKLFRAWLDVQASLTNKNGQYLLNSCEFGEGNAIQTYKNVLKEDTDHLWPGHVSMINTQMSVLKGDINKVKAVRNAMRGK